MYIHTIIYCFFASSCDASGTNFSAWMSKRKVRRLICLKLEIHGDPTETDSEPHAPRKVSGLGESLPPCLASKNRW